MITLTILTYNDAPTEHLSAGFDELGGSIGRADNNQLVLPDPERTISRVHAQVVFRGGGYAIVDRGSNPITVNGRAIGNGQEAMLRDGDRLQIGGYGIGVTETAAVSSAAPSDPFADLGFSGLAFPAAPAPAPAPARASPPPMQSAAPRAAAPWPAPAAPAPSAWSAAPAPGAWPSPAPSQPSWSAASPSPSAGGIPDDWDPFAPDPVKPSDLGRSLGASPLPADDFGLGLGGPAPAALIDMGIAPTPAEDSIDNLFGLGGGGGGDPFAQSKLAPVVSQPNTSGAADPLRALNEAAVSAPRPVADHASELNSPFSMPAPVARPQAPVAPPVQAPVAPPQARQEPKPAQPPAPTAGPAPAKPPGAVFSWEAHDDGHVSTRPMVRVAAKPPANPFDDLFGEPSAPASDDAGLPPSDRTMIRPASAPSQPRAAAPAPASSPRPSPAARPSAAASQAPVARQPAVAGSADHQALLDAFHQGLNAPSVRLDGLTPELMFLVGQMLHESTRGAVELLVARAALKREVRAEVTMIVARENNPLKFSPSAEAALRLLLSPTTPGFMEPAEAMRDAFDDLRAHQLAFLAGMKAALEGVLLRFDPKQLESKLTQRSLLSNLLPASRKAQMWEVFQTLYTQISSEASDDFHELFGKAFLAAYEAQLDRLSQASEDAAR